MRRLYIMKEKIVTILRSILGSDVDCSLVVPEEPKFGHYSTNVAMRLAGQRNEKPFDLAKKLAAEAYAAAPSGFLEKVEAAPPGFINFWVSKKTIDDELRAVAANDRYGASDDLKGKTIMVEFTDLNPFKLVHAGHLMSNAIGESLSRLYESAGATVLRVNYQGDIGLHVAKAIWGIEHMKEGRGAWEDPGGGLAEKINFMGAAYALGAGQYEKDDAVKKEITAINEKLYSRTDPRINELYDAGRKWSLEYFETVYKRLGTKFEHYFFESETGKDGLAVVREHKDVFSESDGAVVFKGEAYGLHTRVFINSLGLPTYEAKELGLNKKKFELYPLDLSVIVTGNEIIDYFKVLLKVMELILPDVAAKTKHMPHGILRLPSGKMSSRTGDVITAESLMDEVKGRLEARGDEKKDLSPEERSAANEIIAIGAVKYSILKQNPGQDIVFDFEKSLSITGDSGPYIQYAYARLQSILRKAGAEGKNGARATGTDLSLLDGEEEAALMLKIFEFPDMVIRSRELYSPNIVAAYLYKLAVAANKFYETTPILKDEHELRRGARLLLVAIAARTIRSGLELLGIKTLERI